LFTRSKEVHFKGLLKYNTSPAIKSILI